MGQVLGQDPSDPLLTWLGHVFSYLLAIVQVILSSVWPFLRIPLSSYSLPPVWGWWLERWTERCPRSGCGPVAPGRKKFTNTVNYRNNETHNSVNSRIRKNTRSFWSFHYINKKFQKLLKNQRIPNLFKILLKILTILIICKKLNTRQIIKLQSIKIHKSLLLLLFFFFTYTSARPCRFAAGKNSQNRKKPCK